MKLCRKCTGAALYDGAKAAQKPIEEELAEKEDEGIELAKLYEEQKPIAEAKVRLYGNASDEAIVRGDPAEAARLSQEAESVLQNLADIKAREQRYYAVSEQLENRLWSWQEAFTGTSILVLGNL